MRVLLVSYDADLIDLLSYALGRARYSVLTARDGDGALQVWQSEHPDVVLMDVALERVNGLEVSRHIRQTSKTPIILMSDHSAETDIIAGFEAGADAVLPKPFSIRQLLARIQSLLRRYDEESSGAAQPNPQARG